MPADEANTQFNAAHQVEPRGARGLHRLIVAGEGVVIGDSQGFQTDCTRTIHQFQWRAGSIGFVGVGVQVDHSASFRSRSAFAITDTELNVIAALAITGPNKTPKNGYKIPAARGTPTML